MIRAIFLSAAILSGFAAQTARAHDNEAQITVSGDQRCILSNGTPDHSIGQFPTRGNPNRFKAQNLKVCVDATPERTSRTVTRTNASGITLTGIMLRPGTAEFYDASSRRGFSRNRASGWQVEGMGGADCWAWITPTPMSINAASITTTPPPTSGQAAAKAA
ncbi:hypothetical protein [Thalassobius sp. MITS945101]|uniref:hypothetical protein n=1 Tax=Thalassobius sp. MITS945101 TaxID=3096994 RepID=UPI003999C475